MFYIVVCKMCTRCFLQLEFHFFSEVFLEGRKFCTDGFERAGNVFFYVVNLDRSPLLESGRGDGRYVRCDRSIFGCTPSGPNKLQQNVSPT